MSANRWTRARRYPCAHEVTEESRWLRTVDVYPCPEPAKILSRGCPDLEKAHNCCGDHGGR